MPFNNSWIIVKNFQPKFYGDATEKTSFDDK